MERVRLAVYDLSNGLAAQLSPLLLGKNVRERSEREGEIEPGGDGTPRCLSPSCWNLPSLVPSKQKNL
jgi:hypothetical protein